MKSETDEISLQGIEFWSTVCDEEVDLAIELSEVREHAFHESTPLEAIPRMSLKQVPTCSQLFTMGVEQRNKSHSVVYNWSM